MVTEIKCRKTKDELYWREKCLSKIMLNIDDKYHMLILRYLYEKLTKDNMLKVYDEMIEELAKEFNIKVIIE
jgi:hypothetical protein